MSIFQKIFGSNKNIDKSEKNKKSESLLMPKSQIPDEEIFVKKFNKNGGKFLYCEDSVELKQNFNNILIENNWDKNLFYVTSNNLKTLFNFPKNYNSPKVSKSECFLSECEYLIANDGSLLFSSNQLAEKKMNQLPDHFIIFAKTSQILKTISEGMTKINHSYKGDIPSNITTIKNFNPNVEHDFLSYGSSPKNLYLLLFEDL